MQWVLTLLDMVNVPLTDFSFQFGTTEDLQIQPSAGHRFAPDSRLVPSILEEESPAHREALCTTLQADAQRRPRQIAGAC
jgi:hypothetical protein